MRLLIALMMTVTVMGLPKVDPKKQQAKEELKVVEKLIKHKTAEAVELKKTLDKQSVATANHNAKQAAVAAVDHILARKKLHDAKNTADAKKVKAKALREKAEAAKAKVLKLKEEAAKAKVAQAASAKKNAGKSLHEQAMEKVKAQQAAENKPVVKAKVAKVEHFTRLHATEHAAPKQEFLKPVEKVVKHEAAPVLAEKQPIAQHHIDKLVNEALTKIGHPDAKPVIKEEKKEIKMHTVEAKVQKVMSVSSEVKESPKKFVDNRTMLICNAYNKEDAAKISFNSAEDEVMELNYRNCHYFSKELKVEDKLQFVYGDGVEGAFEITELPPADTLMLLVFKKREKSKLLTFASYAFPKSLEGKAQVAVIDAFEGQKGVATLTMEDHIVMDKEGNPMKKMQHVRLEEMEFNKVYAMEPGEYDADISYEDFVTKLHKHTSKKLMQFAGGKDYVVMRVGSETDQDLAVFPSPSNAAGVSALLAIFLTMLW